MTLSDGHVFPPNFARSTTGRAASSEHYDLFHSLEDAFGFAMSIL